MDLDLSPDALSDNKRLPFSPYSRVNLLLSASIPRFPVGKHGFTLFLRNFEHVVCVLQASLFL